MSAAKPVSSSSSSSSSSLSARWAVAVLAVVKIALFVLSYNVVTAAVAVLLVAACVRLDRKTRNVWTFAMVAVGVSVAQSIETALGLVRLLLLAPDFFSPMAVLSCFAPLVVGLVALMLLLRRRVRDDFGVT